MKKTVSVLLTLILMLGVFAAAPLSADAALTGTQINLYKNKLNQIYNGPLAYADLYGNWRNIEKCSFAFADVNSDGTIDMLVKFDYAPVANQHMRVFTAKNNYVTELFSLGVNSEFYKNNYVKVNMSHNQGPGSAIWPYNIRKISGNTTTNVANIYSAEKNHPGANTSGGYRSYLDYDNDGVIYYVNGEPYTKAQYNSYVNSFIPAKNRISVSWKKINPTNINNIGKPSSVKLNRSTLGLGVGEDYGLLKTVSPNTANQSVSWSSSNRSIATVDKNGKVIGKKAGTATVTVKTSNGKTASCKVTVKNAPASIKTNIASLKMGVGEKYTISECTNSGSYANAANLRWTSSNTKVATIAKTAGTNKAVITAKATGSTNITIKTYNGKSYTCKLTVYSAPASVKLSHTSLTLKKGQSYTISESSPNGSYANAANLKWSSSNTKVATVTKGCANKATIKAVNAGTATVKITLYNGKTASCKVTVK